MDAKQLAKKAARKVARKMNLVGPAARTRNSKLSVLGASRKQFTVKGITYCEEQGEASVVSGADVAGDVKIPQKVHGLAVTAVKDRAFAGNQAITNVVLPASVRLMGKEAFRGCTGLVFVVLPPLLETIRVKAFAGCTNLKTAQIPGRLRRVDDQAFDGCMSLETLDHHVVYWSTVCMFVETRLPSTVRSLGKACFRGCTSLGEVDIPHGVKEIPRDAFAGCSSLREVTFHSNLESIEGGAPLPGAHLLGVSVFLSSLRRSAQRRSGLVARLSLRRGRALRRMRFPTICLLGRPPLSRTSWTRACGPEKRTWRRRASTRRNSSLLQRRRIK